MTPAPSPIRGRVFRYPDLSRAAGRDLWFWCVGSDRPRVLVDGHAPSLPATYDRCAAAVRKAREEEA